MYYLCILENTTFLFGLQLKTTEAQYLELLIKMSHTVHCSSSQNRIRESVQATDQNIPKHHIKQKSNTIYHKLNHRIKTKTEEHFI